MRAARPPRGEGAVLFSLEGGRLCPAEEAAPLRSDGQYVGLYPADRLDEAALRFQLPAALLEEYRSHKAARFEGHTGYDSIFLNVLDSSNLHSRRRGILIYLDAGKLLVFTDSAGVLAALHSYAAQAEDCSVDRLLYDLFKYLTRQDGPRLAGLEEQIGQLEAALLEERPADYVRKITYIRRDLRVLKAHYEQLYSVLEGIQENENRLFGRDQMRYFKLFAGRLDRLNAEVLNLREYVTQVREAYQAQVDISMNKIMKVLTVVTAVISPLSLIAGWYGMNLQMPETSWSWGYPAVILLSLAVAGCCLAYFHKNKWL